ncbi:MAG: STAS domain-containing protein [Elusimicrobia bacterium]|nr:STAS domain-containing protein [Elusimicrobiota bacterium]
MKKILFTTVCRPLGPKYGDGPSVGYELLFGQVTRAQGIFSPRATHLHFGLDYIAHNIDTPAAILHFPSKRELIRELKKGYDYVGISFILSTFHRMKEVSALARQYAPQAKIILGGYGTVLKDGELKPYGDIICRGEGVAFMRELLGEPPKPMPYDHPNIISRLRFFSMPVSNTGMIFAGLGCPNGCDFCCTSHYFSRRHIKLLPTGADIYKVVSQYLEKDPDMQFTILDEDFLLNKKRAMEFRDCVMAAGKPLSIFVFASFKALSQYKFDELLEMGVDGVWIGYEGTRSGYSKQEGRPAGEILTELAQKGFTVLASMILGFDYQDKQIVREELRGFLRRRPSYCQFLIYGPTPGTPFYARVMKENRMRPEFVKDRELYFHECTGFTSAVVHPKLSKEDIEGLQGWCFDQDYQRLGPSVFRSVRAWLHNYAYLKDSSSEILRKKAERSRQDVRKAYPIFLAGKLFGPNPRIRRWISALERRCHRLVGAPSLLQRFESLLMVAMAGWTKLTYELDLFQHPSPKPRRFRLENPFEKWVRIYGEACPNGAAAELRVRLEQKAASLRVRLEGALDGRNAEQFRRRFGSAMARKKEALVVHMEGLKFIDRKGLAVFYKTLRRYRRRIRVVPPSKLLKDSPNLRALSSYFRPLVEAS